METKTFTAAEVVAFFNNFGGSRLYKYLTDNNLYMISNALYDFCKQGKFEEITLKKRANTITNRETGEVIDVYECISVKEANNSIKLGTSEQHQKMDELRSQGYTWNKHKSISAAGVVLEKGNDIWFFDFDGNIMHNPQSISIKV